MACRDCSARCTKSQSLKFAKRSRENRTAFKRIALTNLSDITNKPNQIIASVCQRLRMGYNYRKKTHTYRCTGMHTYTTYDDDDVAPVRGGTLVYSIAGVYACAQQSAAPLYRPETRFPAQAYQRTDIAHLPNTTHTQKYHPFSCTRIDRFNGLISVCAPTYRSVNGPSSPPPPSLCYRRPTDLGNMCFRHNVPAREYVSTSADGVLIVV